MINTDIILKIGESHKMCEDYIISGEKPYPFIILCDGCSSSKDTDIGARLLAVSIKNTIALLYNDPYSDRKTVPEYKELGVMSINFAKHLVQDLNLPLTALDATAVVAMVDGNRIAVYMYGDGTIISKTADGFKYIDVHFTNGAPYYLSYLLDHTRHTVYREASEKEEHPIVVTRGTFGVTGDTVAIDHYNYNEPLVFNYDIEDLPHAFVGISSDGIDSFIDRTKGERVPLKAVVEEFFAFKSTIGEFVRRRVKRAIDDYATKGIHHSDDVSIGVIVKTEE